MHDLVAAVDNVVDRVAQVGKGLLQRDRGLLETFARRGNARLRRVLDVVRRIQLVDELKLCLLYTSDAADEL